MEQITGTLSNAPAVENYLALKDKPQINGVELTGNKSFEELGMDKTFATKQEFREAEKKYATKQEFQEAEKNYATKQELQDTEKTYATKQEMQDLQKQFDELIDGNEVAY